MAALSRSARLVFADRTDAGHRLAVALAPALTASPAVVRGLCRGGIPVAAPIAADLGLDLGAVATRKLGVPGRRELAFGALASCDGYRASTTDPAMVDRLLAAGTTRARLDAVLARERESLSRQEERFGTVTGGVTDTAPDQVTDTVTGVDTGRASRPVAGRAVVLVDDGVATGASMVAAVAAARAAGAVRVTVAVPVAPRSVLDRLRSTADDAICLDTPADFVAVGLSYEDFAQCTDEQVLTCLRRARAGS